jgi:hypothetical protein
MGKRIAAALALLAGAAWAGDGADAECRCARREVGESGSRVDWEGYRRGVRWHTSVEEARALAKKRGQLLFVYHVAGDLDKEGC